jgi:dihydrofolate reductase
VAYGPHVRPHADDLGQLMDTVRSEVDPGKDICVFGGGQLVTQFVELGLIDGLGVSVIPDIPGVVCPSARWGRARSSS